MIEAAVLGGLGVLAGLGVWKLRWLTPSGAVAAACVGVAVLAGTGGGGVALLLFFFVSSSLLTGYRAARKPAARVRDERTGRSAAQVLANGAVAAVASLVGLAGWAGGAQLALVGALAAATADTWATEIGSSGGWATRSIVGWTPVIPGTSGGISTPGTLSGIAGASLCGAGAALLLGGPATGPLLAGAGGGVVGMLADSVLGATVEGRVSWVTNDVVNLAGTVVGAAAGWSLGAASLGAA